jgi:Peptidase M50B-like
MRSEYLQINTSDAAVYAEMCGCCPSQVWGVIWLIIAFVFFGTRIQLTLYDEVADPFIDSGWNFSRISCV